jgi:class 3 adenylate cyclase
VTAAVSPLPTGTVTFLFTDIERSTELARRLGAEFGALRAEHRRILRQAFADHGGHEIDTAGDGFFVVFQRAGDAVAAAATSQRALEELTPVEGVPVRVRMGLHTAEPFLDDEGYVGVGVHRAARICAVAHGGQTLMSNATAGIVEDLGLHGLQFHEIGEHRLKDMERPQRLFQLDVEGLATDFPPLQALGKSPVLGTLLATDLVGWSRVLRDLGDDAAVAAASRYHAIISGAAETNGGRLVEAIVDSTLSVFERPRDALRAAIAVRDAVRHDPWIPDEHRCPLQCGIHSGRLVSSQAGHLGSAAAHAVRLCVASEPGQILVSYATEALLEGEAPEFELRDFGERVISRQDRPERVFAVAD